MNSEENLTKSTKYMNEFGDVAAIVANYQQMIYEFTKKIEQQDKKIDELERKINQYIERKINQYIERNKLTQQKIKNQTLKEHKYFSNFKNLSDINFKILEKSNRKVFCLDDTRMIYAGGVLLYKFIDDQIYFLMIYSDRRKAHEDIGGKVDNNDTTIYNTVIREAFEETNQIIKLNKETLISSPYFYNDNGKYILYLVEANYEQSKTTKEDFGPVELYENIERIIEWVKCDDFIQKNIKVCNRVNMYHIINYLKSKVIKKINAFSIRK
jgi:hypothetical protein